MISFESLLSIYFIISYLLIVSVRQIFIFFLLLFEQVFHDFLLVFLGFLKVQLNFLNMSLLLGFAGDSRHFLRQGGE
jgi:hypothetical protein